MFYGASRIIFQNAKRLRNHVTDAERIFWQKLKEAFPLLHFRRQHPMSEYVADFYCHKLKLVIEIDGGTHEKAQAYDATRTKIINRGGHRVIRFLNEDMDDHLDCVLEAILGECEDRLIP